MRSWLLLVVLVFGLGHESVLSQDDAKPAVASKLETVDGHLEIVGAGFESSQLVGSSPGGKYFGLVYRKGSQTPVGLYGDGRSEWTIPTLSGYKEFHATDASDTGLVVGYSFVKQKGVEGPYAVPTVYDHASKSTFALENKFGQATGVSAKAERMVGVLERKAVIWTRNNVGWSSTFLLSPDGSPVVASYVCISPNGKRIAATGRFGKRRSRSLLWSLDGQGQWGCTENIKGSDVVLSIRQINNAGTCIGNLTRSNGQNVAALLDATKGVIELGGHTDSASSFGQDINNEGEALVWCYEKNRHAGLLFVNGKKVEIRAKSEPELQWIPGGLSDEGVAIGTQQYRDSPKTRAVVWRKKQD